MTPFFTALLIHLGRDVGFFKGTDENFLILYIRPKRSQILVKLP